jgi:hypothetical protein
MSKANSTMRNKRVITESNTRMCAPCSYGFMDQERKQRGGNGYTTCLRCGARLPVVTSGQRGHIEDRALPVEELAK